MAIDLERLKDNVVATGREIGEKAKEASETAKLKLDIKGKERELDQLYAALGRVYFTAHQQEQDVPEEVMFHGIRAAEAELAGMKEELQNR